MAQENLYNKYRPQTWDDVVEQDAIKQILNREIQTNNLKHVLLFTGGAGTGKTTSARIFANMLEKEKSNIYEINCADHTGVDDVRQLILDPCRTKPLVGMYKIFVLDECFHEDTLVKTAQGNKKIRDIEIGDSVYNLFGVDKVVGKSKNKVHLERLLKLTLSNNKIIYTTKDHKFFTCNGWKEAQYLNEKDFLYDYKDINEFNFQEIEQYYLNNKDLFSNLYVQQIESFHNGFEIVTQQHLDNGYMWMYDLQIEKHPSYYVEDILVHNCHMLTAQSQNALLKVLEEPPKHCIFIMCTTDPQKILSTILSRSFRYDFQLISNEGIINRLKYILETEKNLGDSGCGVNTWDESSLEAIATASKGHLRDSLTILQKCISYSPDINIDVVTKVLGVTNYGTLFDILDSILDNKQTILIESLKTLNSSGMDLKLFIKNFLTFVLDINKFLILKTETNDLSRANLSIPISYANRLTKYNVGHKDKLKHLLKVLLELNSSIRWETNVAPVLETNLLLETM